METGDPGGAERDLERSLGLLEPLYRANPRQLTRLRDLADCYQVFGDLDASRSEWKTAQAWYQKSLELWEGWKQLGSSSIYDQERRAVRMTSANGRAWLGLVRSGLDCREGALVS